MKKKILIIVLFFVIFVSSASAIFVFRSPNQLINSINDENKINNGMLAIMLEDENEEGSYIESTSESWPTDGYTFNSEKSYCVNGSELIWDDTNKQVTTSFLEVKNVIYILI